MMNARLTHTPTPDRAIPVIEAAGVLDLANAAQLRTTMLKCLAEQPDAIIVEMARLRVTDDIQLTVFTAMGRHAAAWPGIPIILCAAAPAVLERLTALGIDRHVTLTANLDQAYQRAAHREPINRLRQSLAPTPMSTQAARTLVTDACQQWNLEHLTSVACLVVTEFVANVIQHAGTTMELAIRRSARYLHLSVRDLSHQRARLVGPTAPEQPGGRGLLVVEALVSSWGCTPTADGKVTWATLSVHQAPP